MAALPITPGQDVLSREQYVNKLPQGDQRGLYSAIFDAFEQQYGREPTANELAQVAPTFKASGSSGTALVAQMANSIQNSPSNIASQQQQQALDSYNKDAGKYDSQTQSVFQQLTGRQANSDELQHFGALLASGQIDQYGVQQLLGQTAEAQNFQTQNYSKQLQGNLQSTQSDYYNKYILPSILQQTAATGRDPNSSGVQQAAVQAGQQQNYQLQNYLAQFGAQQYGQSAQNQQGMYQQYLGNLYGLQNANVNQQLNQQGYLAQQNNNLLNWQMQQQAYNNYLSQYGNRNNGLGSLIGGGIGGALGAFRGPAGMAAGYGLGSALGGGIQGQFYGGGNQQYQSGPSYGGLGGSWGGGGGSWGRSPTRYSDASVGYGSNPGSLDLTQGSGYSRYAGL